MAGLKRKSAVATQSDSKSKSKKAKVDKPAAKRSKDSNAVKPAKISKKSKVDDDSDDLMESDTSEPENGFYGFSADKSSGSNSAGHDDSDVDMSSDEDTKSKIDSQKYSKKTKDSFSSGEDKKSGVPNGKKSHIQALQRRLTGPSAILERSPCQTEGSSERAQSSETKCRHHPAVEEAVGEAEIEITH